MFAAWCYASTQCHYPTTFTNLAGSNVGWANPGAVQFEDGVIASTAAPSNMLEASNYGFAIPPTAVVNGIQVNIKKESLDDSVQDSSVVLFDVNGSSATSQDKATATDWPFNLTFVTYGSPTDLWNETTWTPAAINSANFGFGVSIKKSLGPLERGGIDVIQICIFYTGGTTINNGTINNGSLK